MKDQEIQSIKRFYEKAKRDLEEIKQLQTIIAKAQVNISVKLNKLYSSHATFNLANVEELLIENKILDFGDGKCKHCGISIVDEFEFNKMPDVSSHCIDCFKTYHAK